MKYLAYYDTPENKAENRGYVLAATNKIDYICNALNRIGVPVEIVSASATYNKESCAGKTIQLSPEVSLKLFPCLGTGVLPKRLLGRFLLRARLFFYLLKNSQEGENVLVYHSLGYAGVVTAARRLKKFRLILEVEEIYADVNGREQDRKKEYRVFSAADAYVFPTELLNEKINSEGKPYAVIHGTYQVEPDRKCNVFAEKEQNNGKGKIHCVYAGTFDPRKGGAQAAVAAAEHLPSNYHVHILGFGSEEETERMKEQIDAVTQKGGATVTYDGLLSGEDYIRFIQSCQVGFSTQMPDAAFNDTSFPSKVLSYLANGLRVVSIRIKALERSAVNDLLYYYEENTPEAIAEAVRKIDCSEDYDSREYIKRLDEKFVRDIEELLDDK